MTESRNLAGRGRRLAATLIDAILVPALTILLVMMTDVAEDAEDYADSMWIVWVLVLAVVSYLMLNGLLLWRRGQTIGKALLGIVIVEVGTTKIAPWWKLICIRALFFPLMFVLLPPFILIPLIDLGLIFRKARRCGHDFASGTDVIRI